MAVGIQDPSGARTFSFRHRLRVRSMGDPFEERVEAAHIKPWSEAHDDKPTNGLALCRLCHWSFDQGLMSVGDKYEVLVSKRVQIEQNLPGHVLTLRDRHIFTPKEDQYWPAQDNLDYHRTKTFLR